jgi:hypothetical protein
MLSNSKITEEQRRPLRVLSRHSGGCAEESLRDQGFSLVLLADLASTGFATMEPILVKLSGEERLMVWMQITVAGRKALG